MKNKKNDEIRKEKYGELGSNEVKALEEKQNRTEIHLESQFDVSRYIDANIQDNPISPMYFVEKREEGVGLSKSDAGDSQNLKSPFVFFDEKGNIIIPEGTDAITVVRSVNKGREMDGLAAFPIFDDIDANKIRLPAWTLGRIQPDDDSVLKVEGTEIVCQDLEKSVRAENPAVEEKNNPQNPIGYHAPINKETGRKEAGRGENASGYQIQNIHPVNIITFHEPKELDLETGGVLLETMQGLFKETENVINRICSCTFTILCQKTSMEETFDANGEKTGEHYDVSYVIEIAGSSKRWTKELSCDEIIKPAWVHQITKGKCFVEPGKNQDFINYIRHKIALEDYQQIQQYKTGGWKNIGSRYLYAVAGRCIGDQQGVFKGPDDLKLIYDTSKAGQKEIFDAAVNMKSVIKKAENGTVLFYFVLISLLTTFFKEANFQAKFILALIGKTNSRKTSCGLLFSRIFNRKQVESPDINFRSTYGAIEESMEKFSDACLLIDDFAPQEGRGSEIEQNKKLELVVRSYGDRTARKRMTGYVPDDAKPYHVVSGCCMITGEIDAGVLSSRTRTVRLDFEKDGTNNELLSFYQKNLEIWPTFIADFLEYASANSAQIIRYIQVKAPEFRHDYQDCFLIPRYAESFSVFLCVLNIFYDYAGTKGYLDENSCQKKLEFEAGLIMQVLQKNDFDIKSSNPAVMFVEGLHRSMLDGTLRIVNRQMALNDEDTINDSRIVIDDGEYYCMRLPIAIDHVIRYWKKFKVDFQFRTARIIIPFLVEEELILTREDPKGKKRNTHKLSGCKFTEERFIFICKNKFNEIIEQNN